MFSTRLFIFVTFCFSCVMCERKPCDLEDEKCLTDSARRGFVKFITGSSNWESSDPLHRDLIEKELPNLHLKLTDANLIGLKNCQVDLVRISTKDLKYNYHVGCPHVIFESGYEMKGDLGPKFVEGKGTCKVDHYGYKLLFSGDSEKIIGEDGKPHMTLKNHVLDIEITGKVHYDLQNLFNGDKEKSDDFHKWANENWKQMAEIVKPVMDVLMNKYIENVNAYLRAVTLEDLFYQE